MSDVFITPLVTKQAPAYNGWCARPQRSFGLAPLGGMSSQSGDETVYSAWVQMPCEQSALDLACTVTASTGDEGSDWTVTVETCRQVTSGSAVDTPRAAMGGAFPSVGGGTVYTHCLVLRWVRLQIVAGGNPAGAF